jgi:hypothetical protein
MPSSIPLALAGAGGRPIQAQANSAAQQQAQNQQHQLLGGLGISAVAHHQQQVVCLNNFVWEKN